MSAITEAVVPLSNTGRFFIDGEWIKPTSDAVIDVIDSATEQLYFQVPEAQPADMDLAIGAARRAFDRGPWPRMTHAERAGLSPGDGRQARGAGVGLQRDVATRIRRSVRDRDSRRTRQP